MTGSAVVHQRASEPQDAGICDAHLHVFGPKEEFPVVAGALYEPPVAPLEAYLSVAQPLGIGRFVLVQPSVYGNDNRCLLGALDALGPTIARGVVDVGGLRPPDELLSDWHRRGVRAFRLHTHGPARPGVADRWVADLDRAAGMAADLGWHLDLLAPGWLTEALMPALARLNVDFCLAHLGLLAADDGMKWTGFQRLLNLVREQPSCWIKLTGLYRVSTRADCADVAPMVEALAAAAPDRLVWGTDFPHVLAAGGIDTATQLQRLLGWIPAGPVRHKILWRNAARLYGFD